MSPPAVCIRFDSAVPRLDSKPRSLSPAHAHFKLMLNANSNFGHHAPCRLGLRVAWSANYEQLWGRLFPNVLLEFPPAQRRAEFDCLRASTFISRRPGAREQSGISPLDAPAGIMRIYRIPAAAPDLRGFLPDPSSDVFSARNLGASGRTRVELIPPLLLELASGDGRQVPLEEATPPGHILVGAELDLWIIASGYLTHLFYGATLPTPPPPPVAPPAPPPSTAPSAPPAPVEESGAVPQAHPYRAALGPGIRSPRTFTNVSGTSDHLDSSRARLSCQRETLFVFPSSSRRRHLGLKWLWSAPSICRASVAATLTACVLWRSVRHYPPRHRGAVPPATRRTLLVVGGGGSPTRTKGATKERCTTFEWNSGNTWVQVPFTLCALTRAQWIGWRLVVLIPTGCSSATCTAQHTARAEIRCKTARKTSRRYGPTMIISLGSEDEGPVPKRHKTSQTGCGASPASSPEVIVVEDEESPWRWTTCGITTWMATCPCPPADPSIMADPNNYDIALEPARPAIPPEQQESSSRTTLDDPCPLSRYRPRTSSGSASVPSRNSQPLSALLSWTR
ncbi:hypothetical protein K438DRAFT_1761607 [Mycena galopus ATCC 62051]|nr:hypothetical protein K438DRAFT_1761607 [Mycena galopus ATCC 62051]